MSRFAIRLEEGRLEIVDLEDTYYIEADGDDCLVRLASKRRRRDIRTLDDIEAALGPRGFFRIHRSYLVNLGRIREIRRRDGGRDWEVVMESPVNKVLPVARGLIGALVEAVEG